MAPNIEQILESVEFVNDRKYGLVLPKQLVETLKQRSRAQIIEIPKSGLGYSKNVQDLLNDSKISYDVFEGIQKLQFHFNRNERVKFKFWYDSENLKKDEWGRYVYPQLSEIQFKQPNQNNLTILVDDTLSGGRTLFENCIRLERLGFNFKEQEHYFGFKRFRDEEKVKNLPSWWFEEDKIKKFFNPTYSGKCLIIVPISSLYPEKINWAYTYEIQEETFPKTIGVVLNSLIKNDLKIRTSSGQTENYSRIDGQSDLSKVVTSLQNLPLDKIRIDIHSNNEDYIGEIEGTYIQSRDKRILDLVSKIPEVIYLGP